MRGQCERSLQNNKWGKYQNRERPGQTCPGCWGMPPPSPLAVCLCLHECVGAGTDLFTLGALGQRGRVLSLPSHPLVPCPTQGILSKKETHKLDPVQRNVARKVREVGRKQSLKCRRRNSSAPGSRYVASDFGAIP